MDESDDPIRKLLEQTGWSYTDILKKLEKYKHQSPSTEESSLDAPSTSSTENSTLETLNSKPNSVETKENKTDAPASENNTAEILNDTKIPSISSSESELDSKPVEVKKNKLDDPSSESESKIVETSNDNKPNSMEVKENEECKENGFESIEQNADEKQNTNVDNTKDVDNKIDLKEEDTNNTCKDINITKEDTNITKEDTNITKEDTDVTKEDPNIKNEDINKETNGDSDNKKIIAENTQNFDNPKSINEEKEDQNQTDKIKKKDSYDEKDAENTEKPSNINQEDSEDRKKIIDKDQDQAISENTKEISTEHSTEKENAEKTGPEENITVEADGTSQKQSDEEDTTAFQKPNDKAENICLSREVNIKAQKESFEEKDICTENKTPEDETDKNSPVEERLLNSCDGTETRNPNLVKARESVTDKSNKNEDTKTSTGMDHEGKTVEASKNELLNSSQKDHKMKDLEEKEIESPVLEPGQLSNKGTSHLCKDSEDNSLQSTKDDGINSSKESSASVANTKRNITEEERLQDTESNHKIIMDENQPPDTIIFVDLISKKMRYTNQKRTKQIKKVKNLMTKRLIRRSIKTARANYKKKLEGDNKEEQTEDIRNKLKEQLELLRTKRKDPDLPLISNKPVKFSQHKNKSRLNVITSTLLQKLNKNMSDDSFDDTLSPKSDEEPEEPILSNEGNFMIVNVIGGYKSPTPPEVLDDNENSSASNASDPLLTVSGIMPRKTNDVTKIKGWKNKKFAMAQKQKPSEKLFELLATDSKTDTRSRSVSLDKDSTEESNSPEEGAETSQSKSAFVSDALDQYLTENSQLNISYEVPKLEAEQTIRKTYIDIKFPEFPQQAKKPLFTMAKTTKMAKPKTLAEKRKMLIESQTPQQMPEIKDFMVNMSSKQRKDYEANVLNMRKKLIEENVPFTRRCFVASTTITNTPTFVVYNGQKIRVPCYKNKQILAEITEKRKKFKSAPALRYKDTPFRSPEKPSLLKLLKNEAMRTKLNKWETFEIKLPKVFLEVMPKFGRCIKPKFEHFVAFNNFEISEERIEFALSALKVQNAPWSDRKFTFPLKYANNQTTLRVQRKISPICNMASPVNPIKETDSEITKSVTGVVNKMLDYVENLESTRDIIHDEANQENRVVPISPDAQMENVRINKYHKKRQPLFGPKNVRKTTLEMRRLNCQIVSISLDEENGENKPCEKEFCKMGCVCKSIECNPANVLPNHCGLLGCMFDCSCNYKNVRHNVSLPAGTDIFSEGIINRLRDEAKKNLAKVEKEFTQTVIKTNNQIIMVGDSRERRKRPTKMPKKYDDYVEEVEYAVVPKHSPAKKRPCFAINYEEKYGLKSSYVKMVRIKSLDKIIPFCWIHLLYKCHCKCQTVEIVKDPNIIRCKIFSATKALPAPSPPPPPPSKPTTKYVRNDKTFDKELFCSRTRGLSTSYYNVRNKSSSHKNKIVRSSRKLQKALEVYLQQNADKIMDEDDKTDDVQPANVPEHVTTMSTPSLLVSDQVVIAAAQEHHKGAKRKRKQSHVVLEDQEIDHVTVVPESEQQQNQSVLEKELKVQRRRIRINTKQGGHEFISISRTCEQQSLLKSSQNLDESVQKPLNTNTEKGKKEFLALLNKRSAQLRLLPWSTLAMKYDNGSFQLWFSDLPKSDELVITENGKPPSLKHFNIKTFNPAKDVAPTNLIRWLVTRTVPLDKTGDQILVILAYDKNYWKICGVCEKTVPGPNAKSMDSISISLIEAYGNVHDRPEVQVPVIDLDAEDLNSSTESQDDEHTETMVHENLQDNKKVMFCSKRRFQPKKLISDGIHDDVLKIRQVLWAPIPSVTLACKWRVVCMNVGFAFLSLSRSSYTIKYDDILKAVKLAQSERTTIVLKSDELQKNYPHRSFGIYCVHNYSDKIFVGPYFLNESHDLDTLSFVNNVLVNTNLFNQIKGKSVPGTGFWFHQVTSTEDKTIIDDDITIIQDPPALIDLTCDSDEESDSSSLQVVEAPSTEPKEPTLLQRMLATSPKPNDEETLKAEKALDNLLKTGQLNVNRTIVQSWKNLPKSNLTLAQLLPKTSPVASTCDKSSDCDEDDKLVIDEDEEEEKTKVKEEDDDDDKPLGAITDIRCRYLITNVPNLGYIVAYLYENNLDVVCPITQKTKRFANEEAAVTAVQRVLSKRFILVPPTFRVKVTLVDSVDDSMKALNRAILNGYHIVSSVGVKNIGNSTPGELEEYGLDKVQINQVLQQREQKLLMSPITELARLLKVPLSAATMQELPNIVEKTVNEVQSLKKDVNTYTKKKIDLETKKVSLVERCSKLITSLPSDQRARAQQELDKIINFNTRSNSNDTNEKDSECIELLDDSDTESSPSPVPKKKPRIPAPATKLITRTPFINTACSVKPKQLAEVPGSSTTRSLLSALKASTTKPDKATGKFVLMRKPSASSSTGNVNLSKCTLLKSVTTYSKEKVLVKDVPILVNPDMIKNINNKIAQQKANPVLITSTTSANVKLIPITSTVVTTKAVPALNKITKIPTIGNMLTAFSNRNNAVQTVTAPSVSSLGSLPVTNARIVTIPTVSTPVPILPKSVNVTSMATITPITTSVATNPARSNYIAIKNGNNTKYFQLQTVQSIKRPSTSSMVQPPAKKVTLGTSFLSNPIKKTDK